MSNSNYTKEQIKELKENKYVENCSNKYISFTDKFKLEVIKLDTKWIYHREIFKMLGFPEYIYKSKIVSQSLWNWRYKVKNKWISWLVNNVKWRKKIENVDKNKMSKTELINYLEAENWYLKELHKSKYWSYP